MSSYLGLNRRSWKIISILGSMPVATIVMAVLVLLATGVPLAQQLAGIGAFLLCFVLLPGIHLSLLVRADDGIDIEVRDRGKRYKLLLIGIFYYLLGNGLLIYVGAAPLFQQLGWMLILLLVAIYTITTRWKISVHMAGWGTIVGIAQILHGLLGILFLVPTLLVAYSRFALDCHTKGQVVAGFVLGVVLAGLVFLP